MYLARNLRYLREQRGIKQNDVAEILGIGQSTVGNWEAGKREPNIEMIVHLSRYFGVTLDNLVLKDLRPPMPLYASNIKYLRENHGMTQEDFGHLLGVSQKCISKYEYGLRAVDIEKLMKISDYFGVTLHQLVKQNLSKEGV